MKKRIGLFALTLVLSLASCVNVSSRLPSNDGTSTSGSTEQTEPKSFDELYDEMASASGITLSGTNVMTIYSQNDSSSMTQENTMEVKYSPDTYSNHQSGQSSLISLDFFNVADKAVYYYMDASNEKQQTPVLDATSKEMSWSTFANPFNTGLTSDMLIKDSSSSNSYSLDLEDQTKLEYALVTLSTITTYSFETLESFSLEMTDNAITKLHVVTGKNSVDGFMSSIVYDLSIDYSPETDHTVSEPSPFKHESYHDTLDKALDDIYSGTNFSINYSYDIETSEQGVYHYDFIKTDDVFYKLNKGGDKAPLDSLTAYIKKDDGLHRINKESDGKYSYDEKIESQKDFDEIFDFKKVIPTEAFTKKEDGTYVVSSTYARDFESNINPFISPYSVFEGVVTLNADNLVSSMHFKGSGYVIDYVFKYGDEVKLPFDPKTIPMKKEAMTEVPSNLKTEEGFKTFITDVISNKKISSLHLKGAYDEYDLIRNANELLLKYQDSTSYYGIFDDKYITVTGNSASSSIISDDSNLQTELKVFSKEDAKSDFDSQMDLSSILLNNIDLSNKDLHSKSYEAKIVDNKVEADASYYLESSFSNTIYAIKATIDSKNNLSSITAVTTSTYIASDWDSTKHEPKEGKGSINTNEVTNIKTDGYDKKGTIDSPLFDFKPSFIQSISGNVKLGFGFDNNTAKVGDTDFYFDLADGSSINPSTAKDGIDNLRITSISDDSKDLIQFKDGKYKAVKAGVATVTIGSALNPNVKNDVKIKIV